MTSENKIIAHALASRESFQKLIAVSLPNVFSQFGQNVFDEVVKYYDADSTATCCDQDVIKARLIKEFPKREGLITDYFASLPSTDGGVDNLIQLYADLAKDQIKNELIVALSGKDEKKIEKLVEELQSFEIKDKEENLYHDITIEELEVHFSGKNLIPIYPSVLNEAFGGGIPRQSQICIFARPDVGKTTVAINTAVGAAEAGYKVLYVGNEDPASRMVLRFLTRFTRKSESEIRRNPVASYDEAVRNGYQNLYLCSMHPGTIMEIRQAVEKYEPDVLVVDQIRNLNVGQESLTTTLEQACIKLRNIAKQYNLVSICVTQAGESASGKVRLGMEDVEWSNTGVAGQMDLMIGVGQTQDMKDRGHIMLSFPKNKLSAPLQPIQANIDYAINRITVNK